MTAAAAWLVGAGVVVVLVVVLDRLLASGVLDRRRRARPDRAESGSVATGAFGELVEIFQPSRVHLTEELDRRRLQTDPVGDSAPPVDLESGVVYLPPPAQTSTAPIEDVDSGASPDGAAEAKPTTNPPGAST